MKITSTLLSIPPYISTSWKHIASLHAAENVLIVTLHSGAQITIPHLESSLIDTIFATHARYLEPKEQPSASNPGHFSLELLALENGANALMHDPSQANTPKLPAEVLEQIGNLAQAMGLDDSQFLPPPEENCNCMRCQIAGAIQHCLHPQQEEEEIVSDEELKFSTWRISQQTDQLYLVTDPFDSAEQYQVHLGTPVGCTCGHDHCEHIRAVLNS